MADGTMTITETTHGTVKKIKAVWVSGTGAEDGTASGTTTNPFDGRIIGATTVPDGIAAPTDNYDITVADSDGVDIALGALANRDTANTESAVEASMAGVAHSLLTISVAAAGTSKEGTLYLYIR